MATSYRYDAAISFLAQDEALAEQLSNLLSDRFSVFLYSKAQERVAGTDGELTFGSVFQKESRLVVALYRAGWGDTPWTRIEQTAIRNRGYESGYDFLTLVHLDTAVPAPAWLPKNRIWVGLDRYGINSVAAIVEARINEAGGVPSDDSAVAVARRLEAERVAETRRIHLLRSENGVKLANAEFIRLCEHADTICQQLVADGHEQISVRKSSDACLLYLRGISAQFLWQSPAINTLRNSTLFMRFWRGVVATDYGARRATQLAQREFEFEVLPNDDLRWCERPAKQRLWSSSQLADEFVKTLLQDVRNLETDRANA